MAKQLGTGAKVAIWIGVLATVGVSGWALHKYVYKPWKAKRDAEKNNQDSENDLGSGTNSGIGSGSATPPPATVPTITSFDKLKATLGTYSGRVVTHDTYLLYKTSPVNLGIPASAVGLTSNSATITVKFTNGARWALFRGDVSLENRINEGEYRNGGEWIKVYTGKNAGVITSSKSVVKNIADTIK